jgi:hypothetical protein
MSDDLATERAGSHRGSADLVVPVGLIVLRASSELRVDSGSRQ